MGGEGSKKKRERGREGGKERRKAKQRVKKAGGRNSLHSHNK